MLHELAEMGMAIARVHHRQVTAEPAAPKDQPAAPAAAAKLAIAASAAFDRTARTVRRTILLARKHTEPDRAPSPAQRAAEREPLAYRAEDATRRRARHAGAEPLRPERLDAIEHDDLDEFIDAIDQHSLASFIANLRRDLDRAVPPCTPIWKPRTPQDVWDLCVRAAQLAADDPPSAQPTAPPSPGAPCPASSQSTTGPPATP